MTDPAKQNTANIISPEFRVSFPNVFRPQAMKGSNNEPKYGITMLFKKGENLAALEKAVLDCATEALGADRSKWPKGLRSPFRDQGERDYEGYEQGAVFVNATSKQRPGLVDANVQDIIEERQFYAGCYARASLRAFYYDSSGNKGVGFGVQNIQKTRDGEPLGGRTTPEQDFGPVQGANTSNGAGGIFG